MKSNSKLNVNLRLNYMYIFFNLKYPLYPNTVFFLFQVILMEQNFLYLIKILEEVFLIEVFYEFVILFRSGI